MKFKKMFSIVLMALLCFNFFNIKVFADSVERENIAYENNASEAYTLKAGGTKIQKENKLTKEAAGIVQEVLCRSIAAKANTKEISKTDIKTVSVMSSNKTQAKTYKESDLRLLSAIIYCEAQGETYAGKVAVGIVVMNRKASSQFPNTINGVIYQKNQFQPTRNGALKKALRKYDEGKFKSGAGKQCVKAAKETLDGTKTVTYKSQKINLKGYHFFSCYLKGCRIKIGNHQFK
ncbi:cell wall hydrolase [[Clostridium] polysaccharolyticum]|uniref:Cell Wall Hydrolase n=1 Tax=[Clostridium] polysaccharolyticum TaxID=29364 RepID=A0A1I0D362_9FIRM|nr:cell wall hydrolase [[Clostridium] polysaccharolyticum]SET26530.1 Cell Wall Hydrolase [[Clostridium] polysaccharolyticum]